VRPAKPQIAKSRYSILGQWRCGVRLIVIARIEQEIVDLFRIEPCEA
jgi:hypothetical protein